VARFNFRQGIARRQEDGSNNPNNLQPSNGGSYVDLLVSPDPTIFLISHYDIDYMQSENASITKAWGPFTSGTDYWLYWDIDFITGELTRQFTTEEPFFGSNPPPNPAPDKHWFDIDEEVMKVWTGSSWVEKVRLFSAKYQGGATLVHYPLGSQVGLNNKKTDAGKILFDPDGKPLQKFQRNRRGQFITTETPLNSQFNRIANFRVEAAIVQGEATEQIPIHHAVAFDNFDELILAKNTDPIRPAIGVATEDMNPGEIRSYITKGFIVDDVNWDWSAYSPQTGIYVGPNGELLPEPDPFGITQQRIGYVVNRTTVFIDITEQVLLEPPTGNEIGILVDRDSGRRVGRKIPFIIDDLKDVDALNPSDGDVLIWDASVQKWVLESNCCGGGGGPGATTLDDLTDVTIGTPTDGYTLTYNGTTSQWEPTLNVDESTKVSSDDILTGFLEDKVVPGSGITIATLNPGGNEQIEISSTASIPTDTFILYVSDVTPPGSGIVSDHVYVPNTSPPNLIVSEATSDEELVRIHFRVESESTFFAPTVLVDVLGDNVTGTLTQDPQNPIMYDGYADITVADGLTAGRVIDIESYSGPSPTTQLATTSVLIKRAEEPPQFQVMMFDTVFPTVSSDITSGYPGGTQTTIKSGDIFYVTGTVENSATLVYLVTGDAVGSGTFSTDEAGSTLDGANSGGAGFRTFTIRFTGSSASGAQTADAIAVNSFGTESLPYTTLDTVPMDQVFPSVSINSVTYPVAQQALKGSEVASVSNTVSGQDYVYYYENGGAGFIDIANPTTYEVVKNVTRIGGGYVYNANNFGITAYKTSNGTVTIDETGDVNISNVAPTVAITGASSRLISSPSGQNYTITLTFTQELIQAPTVISSGDPSAGARGTVTGSGDVWSFNINVDDADTKGTFNWTIDDINTLSDNIYNGISITSGSSYEIGGFTTRTVTVGALEQVVDIGVDISDPSKVTVKYAGTTDNLTYRGSDLTQFQKGWSTVDGGQLVFTAGADPFQNYTNFVYQDPLATPTSWLLLTDAAFAGANTSGTLLVEIGEGA